MRGPAGAKSCQGSSHQARRSCICQKEPCVPPPTPSQDKHSTGATPWECTEQKATGAWRQQPGLPFGDCKPWLTSQSLFPAYLLLWLRKASTMGGKFGHLSSPRLPWQVDSSSLINFCVMGPALTTRQTEALIGKRGGIPTPARWQSLPHQASSPPTQQWNRWIS